VHIIVFPGVQNLPNFAAEANGFFEKRGLAIKTTFTKSSAQQRNGLASGEYDIAHSAVDNAVAMADIAGEDVVIVVGLDHGFNKLIVRPGITSYDDLRGKTLGVDAPDTAFALVVYEMLKRKGLKRDDYNVQSVGATRFRLDALIAAKVDFAILNLPFNLFAQRAGLAVLDNPTDVIGAYQSTGGFVKRAWAEQHRRVLVQYIAAYVEGLRWSMAPANRSAVIELIKQRLDLSSDIADQCYRQISDPKSGFARDAKLDLAGMATLLALRADFSGKPSASTMSSDRYIDETYYRDALAALQPTAGS
jgi:ABC-type nitrate/sulfonate/bicarbonate transport system substrate-binding protein